MNNIKNIINYYYELKINEFKKREECFVFEIDNIMYEFLPFYGDVNELYKNYLTILNNGKYCHEILFNKYKNLITYYINTPYILIKKNLYLNSKITINEILTYDVSVYESKSLNWKKLWKDKIDYYEGQINQFSFKYKKLRSCFDYYIGLTETAISVLNYIDFRKVNYHICHKRINKIEDLDEFFNPINIIIDNKVRDIAEFVKVLFLRESIDVKFILYHIQKLNFSYEEILLFIARLLYPSYFFDLYDKIIQEKLSEDKIEYYIKKNESYESFLKTIYNNFKKNYKIPEIEWLEI